MKRGELLAVVMPGDCAKPCPAPIIEADPFEHTGTVTALPLPGTLVDAPRIRLTVQPNRATFLRKPSQVMVDKAIPVKRERAGPSFGVLDDPTMLSASRTLAVFLGIARAGTANSKPLIHWRSAAIAARAFRGNRCNGDRVMLIGILCRAAGQGKLRPHALLLAWLAVAICPMAAGAQAIDARQILACTRIADATARLACYDQAAGYKLPTPSVTAVATAEQVSGAPPAAAPALPVAPATDNGPRLRLALGGGFGVGDYYAFYKHIGHGGYAVSNSGPGNSGALTSAQLWLDNWIAPDWSIGLELQTVNSRGRLKLVLPGGYAILTEDLHTGLSANVTAQQITADLAWRPDMAGALQPWIAGGLIVGHAKASADFFITNPFLGKIGQGAATSLFYPGFKLTPGMDYMFNRHYYMSLQPGLVIVTGQPVGLQQRYLNFGVSLLFGRAF